MYVYSIALLGYYYVMPCAFRYYGTQKKTQSYTYYFLSENFQVSLQSRQSEKQRRRVVVVKYQM